MRNWAGYQDDAAAVGDGMRTVNNVSLRVKGQVSRRPCLGSRITLSAQSLGAMETSSGSWLVANNAGTLTSYNMATDAATTVKTGLAATPRGNFANASGQLYFANGTNALQVLKQGSAVALAAGITGPASAPTAGTPAAGSITAGVHLIRFRWKDSTTGYVSNPSPVLTFTAAGSQNCPLTLGTTADTKADQMVIEMTLAAGSTYYAVATVADASSYTISVSDAVLATQQLANVYAGPDGYGCDVPPIAPLLCEHRGRLFVWGASDNLLYWSRAGYPEAFDVLDWARNVTQGKSDRPTALASYFNDLYLMGARSMRRLVYTGDPAAGMLVSIPGELGAYNQRCIAGVDGSLFGFGSAGAWIIDGIQPDHISRPIDETWQAEVDEAQSEEFHVFYDPQERAVWFCYVKTGDDKPQTAICYEQRTRQWTRRSFRNTIQCSLTVGDTSRATRTWLGDGDGGYCWKLEDDRVGDGVPASMTSAIATCDTGSTTTALNIVESLSTAPSLAGCILYDETADIQRLISSNTANTITLATALPSAPAVGYRFYVGSVRCELISDWIMADALNKTMSPVRLNIDHLSDTQQVDVRVSVYANFSASATPFTTQIDDTSPLGVTLTNNNTVATVDTSVVGPTCPVPFADAKCVRWQLVQQQPRGQFKLLDMQWQFESPRDITKERIE